jgi:hypothetical protein
MFEKPTLSLELGIFTTEALTNSQHHLRVEPAASDSMGITTPLSPGNLPDTTDPIRNGGTLYCFRVRKKADSIKNCSSLAQIGQMEDTVSNSRQPAGG